MPGALDFRAATVDPSTGAVALRGILPNPSHSLLPGMFVSLRLTVGIANHAFLVPQVALQRDAQGAYVLSVGSDSTVVLKRVQTEGAEGTNWIVSSGLEDGDRIIVAGIQSAHPGAKVAATEEPSAAIRSAAVSGSEPMAGARGQNGPRAAADARQ